MKHFSKYHNNRGTGGIIMALSMLGIISAGALTMLLFNSHQTLEASNSRDLFEHFYIGETLSIHSHAREVGKIPNGNPSSLNTGRYVATLGHKYGAPTANSSDHNLNLASYVDGTPLTLSDTTRYATGSTILSPGLIRGAEYYTKLLGSAVTWCGATHPIGRPYGLKTCISETNSSSIVVSDITSGYGHTCVIIEGGVKCWGRNDFGQLGDNSTTSSLDPVDVVGLQSGVTSISAGDSHTCAIINEGIKCWGQNFRGGLGNNSTVNSSIPVDVVGLSTGVTFLEAGYMANCAIVNGGAKCWGSNAVGVLGNSSQWFNFGPDVPSHVPVDVYGLSTGVTSISIGYISACAVVNGAAICWGDNSRGRLGNNSNRRDSYTPVGVYGLSSGVTSITVGDEHACAIVNGGAKCWGANRRGQLGNNSDTESNIPVDVIGLSTGVTSLVAGGHHTCAIVNGEVKCWGLGSFGNLGNNSTADSHVAVNVVGLQSGVDQISANLFDITCAISSGAAKCWGDNYWGQLGDRTTTNSSVPVDVMLENNGTKTPYESERVTLW